MLHFYFHLPLPLFLSQKAKKHSSYEEISSLPQSLQVSHQYQYYYYYSTQAWQSLRAGWRIYITVALAYISTHKCPMWSEPSHVFFFFAPSFTFSFVCDLILQVFFLFVFFNLVNIFLLTLQTFYFSVAIIIIV
jgi:hypothetical protein